MTESSSPVVILFATVEEGQTQLSTMETLVTEHNGDLVKRLADGVMAVFRAPADAVSCVLAFRDKADANGSPAPAGLRAGLALGEAYSEGDDYFGTPVVIARRLCDAASAGQVLCTGLIAQLAAASRTATFQDIGELDLKGLAAPVRASAVLPPDTST